ncbi:MAG: hypothetical protein UX75_C0036G0026 [Candidatus Moranbacteria bacterium GW2011_GWE2_47_10]|nr:MAG: hypothetical protein UX75_C0036G0026 [Candidatus Moranbacteria bacterium GW2011_GWE2_47_10]
MQAQRIPAADVASRRRNHILRVNRAAKRLLSKNTHYFFGDDLEVYLEDSGDRAENLRLVFCEPESLPQIQIENWDLHEDYEVAPEVKAAVNALNELLAKQPPHCWYPGKVAAIIK